MSQGVWYALDDHMDDATYINGVQSNFGKGNLLLIQKRDKLERARETLHQTDYYKYWSPTMYRRIVNGQTSRQRQEFEASGMTLITEVQSDYWLKKHQKQKKEVKYTERD